MNITSLNITALNITALNMSNCWSFQCRQRCVHELITEEVAQEDNTILTQLTNMINNFFEDILTNEDILEERNPFIQPACEKEKCVRKRSR